MYVKKCLNNNAVICIDSKGKELVAFGKGIGFQRPPYELKDISKIERTFYDLDRQSIESIHDIPEEIIMFTSDFLNMASRHIDYPLNSNVIFTLSDHILFAIKRNKKGIYVSLPRQPELIQLHPIEFKLARVMIKRIKEKFDVELGPNEDLGIAMYFINCKNNSKSIEEEIRLEKVYLQLLNFTTKTIENTMNITIMRDTFNYCRFASHIQYLLRRLMNHNSIQSENNLIYDELKNQHKEVAECVEKIAKGYEKRLDRSVAKEEKLYLLLHINRICSDYEV